MKTRSFLSAVAFATMVFIFTTSICSCGGSKRIASTEIAAVCSQLGTVNDRDGNTYKTAKIGEDEWIVENLRTKPLVAENLIGTPLEGKSKCYDDIEGNCEKYGRLYNLEAAKEICPDGWELPSWPRWKTLGQTYGELRKFLWMRNFKDTLNDERVFHSIAKDNCKEMADKMDYRAKVDKNGQPLTYQNYFNECENNRAIAIKGMERRRDPNEQLKDIEKLKQMGTAEKEAMTERDRCGFFELKGGICEEGGVCLFKDLEGYYYTGATTSISGENAVKLTRDNKFDDLWPVPLPDSKINFGDFRSVRCVRKK